jgi:hypothetical protein
MVLVKSVRAVMMFWNPRGENFVEPQTRCYHRRLTFAAQGLKHENFWKACLVNGRIPAHFSTGTAHSA